MATIYAKTGSDKCIILESGEAINRPMALPATWTKLRLAVGLSLCASSGSNDAPASASISNTNRRSLSQFGLKDTSTIAPGFAGSKFIGWGEPSTSTIIQYFGNSSLFYGDAPFYGGGGHTKQGRVYNGVTVANVYFNGTIDLASAAMTGSTVYFKWVMCEIDSTSQAANQVLVRLGYSSSYQTDASYTAMQAFLASPENINSTTVVSGGWWGSGQIDLKNFYFRLAPLVTVRARIHNYGFRVIL